LKLYKEGLTQDRRKQILSEGRALSRIRSPNVARCYGVDVFEDRPYLVLEFIEGERLDEWGNESSIEESELVGIVLQIAEALIATHDSGLLHLDVKPQNVIVGENGDAALIDFGLSQNNADQIDNRVYGTPSYLAPERIGNAIVDERADVYGLGAIIYFLLTNRSPIEGESKSEVIGKLADSSVDFGPLNQSGAPRSLKEICSKCLARNPDDRFSSVDEFKKQLLSVTRPRPSLARAKHFGIIACVLLLGAVTWQLAPGRSPSGSQLKEIAQVIKFLNGTTENIPLQNDFRLKARLTERSEEASDFDLEIDSDYRPENDSLVELVVNKSYRLRIENESDFSTTVVSLRFADDSEVMMEAEELDGDEIVVNTKYGAKTSVYLLTANSATPPGELEYLWILSSENPIPKGQVANLINRKLADQPRVDREPGNDIASGVYRSVEEDLESELISELLISYQTFDY